MNFRKIIENTIVPMNLPEKEKQNCYDKVIECVKDILPNKLYRFRVCSERSLSAFYNRVSIEHRNPLNLGSRPSGSLGRQHVGLSLW